MKKLLFFIIILLSITPKSYALKNYGRYLEIENGKSQITLNVGESRYLSTTVKLTGLPTYKNLEYSSGNSFIASVDNSGKVTANAKGKTYITVTDQKGRTDSILIIVKGGAKSVFGVIFLLFLSAAVLAVVLKIKPVSR